jgi:hypothetical protein
MLARATPHRNGDDRVGGGAEIGVIGLDRCHPADALPAVDREYGAVLMFRDPARSVVRPLHVEPAPGALGAEGLLVAGEVD